MTVNEFLLNLIGENWSKKEWIEEQDLINKDYQIDRKNAARILHMYMQNELSIKDVKDITPAYVIKDIAQIYLRGLMEPIKIGEICMFDLHGDVNDEEIKNMKCKLSVIINTCKLKEELEHDFNNNTFN